MTDLDKHVNQPGRAKLVKQVRSKIDELGIEYIFFQFISVTGRVVGKGIPTDHWERTCEKGFQLVYGATANLFTDRHGNYIGYGPEAKELVGIPDPETFCQLPWDKKVARVFVTCFRNREERDNPGAHLTSDCRGNLRIHAQEFKKKHGYQLRVGTEPEMMWLTKNEDGTPTGKGYSKPYCYHIDQFESLRPVFMQVMKYARAKMRITQNQSSDDWFIYNEDDPVTREVMKTIESKAKKAPFSIKQNHEGLAAFANDNKITINPNKNQFTMTMQELALQGKHNLYNSMASGIAARILEVRKDLIRECLSDFQNIEHRLELVNDVYGISFINDSKATNVNSTWYALESMNQPVVWIAGGVDKGNDYTQLDAMVKAKVKTLVCLGKDNAKLIEAFGPYVEQIIEVDTMREAVYKAYKAGVKGDAVLLSPACASFDLFDDYEDRGRQFKEAVRNL